MEEQTRPVERLFIYGSSRALAPNAQIEAEESELAYVAMRRLSEAENLALQAAGALANYENYCASLHPVSDHLLVHLRDIQDLLAREAQAHLRGYLSRSTAPDSQRTVEVTESYYTGYGGIS